MGTLRAPQMSKGSKSEKKNRRMFRSKGIGEIIKQLFKEQPEVGAGDLLEMTWWKGLFPASGTTYDPCTHCIPSPLSKCLLLPDTVVVICQLHHCKSSGDQNGIVFALECQSSGALVWWEFCLFACFFNVCWIAVNWREGRKDADWSGHSWFRGRSKQGCWLLLKRALALWWCCWGYSGLDALVLVTHLGSLYSSLK